MKNLLKMNLSTLERKGKKQKRYFWTTAFTLYVASGIFCGYGMSAWKAKTEKTSLEYALLKTEQYREPESFSERSQTTFAEVVFPQTEEKREDEIKTEEIVNESTTVNDLIEEPHHEEKPEENMDENGEENATENTNNQLAESLPEWVEEQEEQGEEEVATPPVPQKEEVEPQAPSSHVPVETPVLQAQPITTEMSLSAMYSSEFEALCKIVEAEAGGEDMKGKILVANVVMKRVSNPRYPNTVTEVVFQSGQFTPVRNGSYVRANVSPSTLEAVTRALSGEDYSQGALYFNSAGTINRTMIFQHGGHRFYL